MSMRAAWPRYFSEMDVFFCPTNFTPPFPLDNRPFKNRSIATPEGERSYEYQAFWIARVTAKLACCSCTHRQNACWSS